MTAAVLAAVVADDDGRADDTYADFVALEVEPWKMLLIYHRPGAVIVNKKACVQTPCFSYRVYTQCPS